MANFEKLNLKSEIFFLQTIRDIIQGNMSKSIMKRILIQSLTFLVYLMISFSTIAQDIKLNAWIYFCR